MNTWQERTHEERSLLNPAFCSLLIWHAAKGASEANNNHRSSLSFNEAFLVLPLVLHAPTRFSIPNRINSSFPIWIKDNPLNIASLPMRAKSLIPYTKEAISFGARGGILRIEEQEIHSDLEHASSMRVAYRKSSNEVQQCRKTAEFIGKWFSHTGNPETIFTLLGVRP